MLRWPLALRSRWYPPCNKPCASLAGAAWSVTAMWGFQCTRAAAAYVEQHGKQGLDVHAAAIDASLPNMLLRPWTHTHTHTHTHTTQARPPALALHMALLQLCNNVCRPERTQRVRAFGVTYIVYLIHTAHGRHRCSQASCPGHIARPGQLTRSAYHKRQSRTPCLTPCLPADAPTNAPSPGTQWNVLQTGSKLVQLVELWNCSAKPIWHSKATACMQTCYCSRKGGKHTPTQHAGTVALAAMEAALRGDPREAAGNCLARA